MLFATTGEFAGALSAFGASNGVEFVAIVPLTWRRRAKKSASGLREDQFHNEIVM